MKRTRPKLTRERALQLLERAAHQLYEICQIDSLSAEAQFAAITGAQTLYALVQGQNPEGTVWHKTPKPTTAKVRNTRSVLQAMNNPECKSLSDAYDLASAELQIDERAIERSFLEMVPDLADMAREVLAKRRKG
jgi:hypothetical protein